jgi:hypothetical protein
MSKDNDNDNYDVGYKKPPESGQFKKGESGNKNGRPKKDNSFPGIFKKVMEEDIDTLDKRTGKKLVMSRREIIVRQTINNASNGDKAAIKQVSDWEKKLGHMDTPEPGTRSGVLVMPAAMTQEEWNERFSNKRH